MVVDMLLLMTLPRIIAEENNMNYSPFLVRDRVTGELYSPQVMLERLLRNNVDIFIRLKYM